MRKLVITLGMAGALAFAPLAAPTASAETLSAGSTVAVTVAQPQDRNDDGGGNAGLWGLLGLLGLTGLMGLRKQKEQHHRVPTDRTRP